MISTRLYWFVRVLLCIFSNLLVLFTTLQLHYIMKFKVSKYISKKYTCAAQTKRQKVRSISKCLSDKTAILRSLFPNIIIKILRYQGNNNIGSSCFLHEVFVYGRKKSYLQQGNHLQEGLNLIVFISLLLLFL
jgi:hypothetical protein